ncbi:(d)CMP kinase [Candidatus Haliotispira prima]|uniref:Cytidylate kinase n=1 Tax=Candidatus Haliotispira prima TaxID=3034016 RepID=A0ABY8MIN4_9SPIO|nr:(d)CMP kinase [Candidatus Haliotispira prima]
MIITIDGPAGVGKSSVSGYLAKKENILLLKSGSFYRALSLGVKDELAALPSGDPETCYELRDKRWQRLWHRIQSVYIRQQDEQILLNGQDVTDRLGTPEMDFLTPLLSKLPPVRHFINNLLRSQAEGRSLIAEGRDMGTVVFPHARHKFFLEAGSGVRARRRWEQLHPKEQALRSLAEIENQISVRDKIDRNKKEGTLRAAENAHIIDTGSLTFEDVCQIIAGSLNNRNICNHLG